MPTTPLKIEVFDEEYVRPRDWNPKKIECRGPLKMARICILGMFLPAILVAGPVYIRYRVYAEQLYPLAASDQRLIDGKVSTTWCQGQLIQVNTTFNAYLINGEPKIRGEIVPVTMTRHLVLEDDMKEYWGFYLLRGSSVTVSTCVRWPGASLTIIRGHKHLHECAFVGDDSSEELEELLEVAAEQGLLNGTGLQQIVKDDSPSNVPDKMKRVRQGVQFLLHKGNTSLLNATSAPFPHFSSHELDTQAMREILTKLFEKTQDTKKKQNQHHHYAGVFREDKNIDRPPVLEKLTTATTTEPDDFSTHSVKNIQKAIESSSSAPTSSEVLEDVLLKINSLGDRSKKVMEKLVHEYDKSQNHSKDLSIKLNNVMNNSDMSLAEKIRKRRQLVLSSNLENILNADESDADAAIETEDLHPDEWAEDRGTVNETTLNDRSNSEFWSSFSSSEERLLDCKGLILNLPLTPNRYCTPEHESKHSAASGANAVTYRVPIDGYYFFLFNSENEVQPNYVRIKFDLMKTVYNTSNPVRACTNSTHECSLPFSFFSWERTVLELPLTANVSQGNHEYVVISHCQPRTAVYLFCIIMVPLLILCFAFH